VCSTSSPPQRSTWCEWRGSCTVRLGPPHDAQPWRYLRHRRLRERSLGICCQCQSWPGVCQGGSMEISRAHQRGGPQGGHVSTHIIAMGGGGFMMKPDNPLLDDYVLAQATSPRPRVLFLPTAQGDSHDAIARFYNAFERFACVPTLLSIFRPFGRPDNFETAILSSDVVSVAGGTTRAMIAVWREVFFGRAWGTERSSLGRHVSEGQCLSYPPSRPHHTQGTGSRPHEFATNSRSPGKSRYAGRSISSAAMVRTTGSRLRSAVVRRPSHD